MLLAAAEAVSRSAALSGHGLTGAPTIDWPALMRRKRETVAPSTTKVMDWLGGLGVELISGDARFASDSSVAVGDRLFRAEHIAIATGAAPVDLGFPGARHVTTSEQFLDLDELPKRIVFIGGGFISFEFAELARRAGSSVTIVHRSRQVLKGFDSGLADQLVARYRSLGIRIMLDTPVLGVSRAGAPCLRVITPAEELECDLVVHGAGRVADLGSLGLGDAGVEFGPQGVKVDAHLRSLTNPHVWAAGDAAEAGPPLTPVASKQGAIVATNILGGDAVFDPSNIPSVVFSDPPLASVGLSVAEAGERDGLEVVANDMSGWYTQARVGNDAAGARIVKESATGRILGAHLLGINADEVVNLFALAIRAGMTAEQLREMTWAYPTAGFDLEYLG